MFRLILENKREEAKHVFSIFPLLPRLFSCFSLPFAVFEYFEYYEYLEHKGSVYMDDSKPLIMTKVVLLTH